MRALSSIASIGLVLIACGGSEFVPSDASLDATTDGPSDAMGGRDGSSTDAGSDASEGGGDCTPPKTACAMTCPPGTKCLKGMQGPMPIDLGCTPIPSSCANGVATCQCMKQCFCNQPGEKCFEGSGVDALFCTSGAISRRAFKKDIAYVDDAERATLARETLAIPLATYVYKSDPSERHLGFIIDDQPAQSFAVRGDRTHVDEYGYTSMLLATIQQQQKQIDALEHRLEALERKDAAKP